MRHPYIESATALSDVSWTKKTLESYLAIDSPFETFAVGLHMEFID